MRHYLNYMAIELAGLLWLWAELLILWFVHRVARRLGAAGPLPPVLLDAGDAQRLRYWSLWFAVASVLLVSRYVVAIATVLRPGRDMLGGAAPELGQWVVILELQSVAVWASLVTSWVVLELLIVWRGVAAFRFLRLRLAERNP